VLHGKNTNCLGDKMTEKQAALLTYIMWLWLEANPGKRKSQFPFFAHFGFHKMRFSCPWCEINPKCKTCPLYNKDMPCTFDDSIYSAWLYYSYRFNKTPKFRIFKRMEYKKECKKYAKMIKETAINEYRKLNSD